MAKPLVFVEHMAARFPEGTFARIGKVLRDGEDRTDFVREAVEREIDRRSLSGNGSRRGKSYRPEAASPERKAAWDRLLASLKKGITIDDAAGRAWKFHRGELYNNEEGSPRGAPKGW